MARFDELGRRAVQAWRRLHGRALDPDGQGLQVPYASGGSGRGSRLSGPRVATGAATAVAAAPAPAPVPAGWDHDVVPRGVRVAAAWSWRLLVITVPVVLVLWGLAKISVVVVPLIVALLLAALLAPAMRILVTARVPRSLAAGTVVVAGIAAVAGLLTAVINAFVGGAAGLGRDVERAVRQLHGWLKTGPLHLTDQQLDDLLTAGQQWLAGNRAKVTSGALDAATATALTVGHVLVGLFLVLFTLFFFLRDGARIWQGLCRLLMPAQVRDAVHEAGHAVWATLTSYVRATVLVALVDAVGIGIAMWFLDIPLWLPLAALVFMAAFIPIVGATLSGTVAVLVAWVSHGLLTAVILFAVVIAVQQLEGHVLQPLIMGRAVAIHPLAVLVAIATGAVIAGIIGALIAVPVVAVLNTGIRHLHHHSHRAGEPHTLDDPDDPVDPAEQYGPLADQPTPEPPPATPA